MSTDKFHSVAVAIMQYVHSIVRCRSGSLSVGLAALSENQLMGVRSSTNLFETSTRHCTLPSTSFNFLKLDA
jgi:hypothetical protein